MTPRTFINLARAQRNADRAARRADAWLVISLVTILAMTCLFAGMLIGGL